MSEEMKNLNNEPEKAPVENKPEAAKLPLDKKTLGIIIGAAAAVLVLVLVLVLTLGGNNGHTHSFVEGKCECGETDPNYTPGNGETETTYTLGLGLVFGDITNAQINATIATVVLDENGVIVSCKIDAIQNKYTIGDSVVFTHLLTKKELGFDYKMSAFGTPNVGAGPVKEWFEQAAAFEAYVVGKTAAELEALELQEVNGHWISKDEDLLNAGCTIQIDDFIAAVVKACKDDQSMSFTTDGEIVLGLAANNSDNGTSGDDFEATIKMNIDYAAVVTVDGVIVASLSDAAQPQLTVIDGEEVTSTSVGKGEGILKTKRELKEDYKMSAFGAPNVEGGTVKEWYLQSEAFSKYIVGLTPEEVANLETALVNGHYISTDDALLNAGCTIQITGMQAVVAEAAGYVAPEQDEEKTYTLGLGLVFGDITNAQTNATIATVVLDENGVIVSCKIDAIQNKYTIGDSVVFTHLLTKKELGFDYKMSAFGTPNVGAGPVKEWFEQAAAFEAYVVGKTAAELEALELQEVNGHWISKDEDLLNAGCTIQIDDFIAAVVKACKDDQSMSFTTDGEIVLGLAANNSDNGTSGDDFEATIKMNIDYAAVVTVDGVIVASLSDAAQPQLTVIDGEEVTSTSVGKGEGILKTKRELKEDYKMSAFGAPNVEGGTVKEWYLQSEAFSNYIVGLTAEEVANLETTLVNGHYISSDDALLSAGCTIQITGIQAVVAEAAGYVANN